MIEIDNLNLENIEPKNFEFVGALMDSCQRGVLVTDNEGSICYVNERLCEITKYKKGDLLGENPRIFRSGNTSDTTYLKLWNTVSTGRSWRGRLQNRKKSGERYLEDITISPLKDNRRAISHFFGMVEELDEQQLNQASKKQELYGALVSSFSMGVVNELNNIITGILGHYWLARKEPTHPDNFSRHLDGIAELARKLSSLSSKLSIAGKNDLAKEELIDLSAITMQTVDTLETIFGPELFYCRIPTEPTYVVGDPILIENAVAQLVRIVRGARSELSDRIEINVGITEWEGEAEREDCYSVNFGLMPGIVAYVQVTDTTSKINTPFLEQSILPYISSKLHHDSLGLGIVLGVLRAHCGTLEVIPHFGQGMTVRMMLPLARGI